MAACRESPGAPTIRPEQPPRRVPRVPRSTKEDMQFAPRRLRCEPQRSRSAPQPLRSEKEDRQSRPQLLRSENEDTRYRPQHLRSAPQRLRSTIEDEVQARRTPSLPLLPHLGPGPGSDPHWHDHAEKEGKVDSGLAGRPPRSLDRRVVELRPANRPASGPGLSRHGRAVAHSYV